MRIDQRLLLKEESSPENPGGYGYYQMASQVGLFPPESNGQLSMLQAFVCENCFGMNYVIIGAPQFILDMFDYNGDGLIGENDLAYAQYMKAEVQAYVQQGGDWDDIPFYFAKDFRENWQELNQQFGLNLPNPNGFSETYSESGNPYEVPDAVVAENQNGGLSSFSLSDSKAAINLLRFCRIVRFNSLIADTEYAEELLALADFNGDGSLEMYGPGSFDYNNDGYIASVIFSVVQKLSYPEEIVDFSSFDIIDIVQSEEGWIGFLTDIMYNPEAQNWESGVTGMNMYEFLQMVFQRWVDSGLIDEIPTAPDGDGGQSDYERLIQLLSNYGEGGTNFQDLLQLLSTWGQGGEAPPTPPPPPVPPPAAP